MPGAQQPIVKTKGGARLAVPDTVTAGRSLRSTTIESAEAKAAMQPWVAMECYQLSSGKQVSLMDSLDLGSLQVVRERQLATIQKLGTTPTA
jgi:AraC family ethanolamine operon transcriptional activator